MAASVTSPADVLNLALRRIGYKLRVGSLYEGSVAAKQALDIYGQTRDASLRMFDWGFAEKIAAGTLTANVPPNNLWTYEYVYPSDMIRLRNMYGAGYLADRNNPLPVLYTIADNATPAKVIWSNLASATFVYTKQVTDPTLWEPLFIESLSVELGKRLAPVLSNAEAVKMLMEDEKMTVPMAEGVVG